MYATEHRTHGDPAQPYVAMTTPEAVALDGTLQALREHLNGRIAWTLAQRMLDPLVRDKEVAAMRAQLRPLVEFLDAHRKAHGLAR